MKQVNFIIRTLFLGLLLTTVAHADDTKMLVGNWCFYEQTAAGSTVSEKVDITFNDDLTYIWQESESIQKGTWKVDNKNLVMSDIGSHAIKSLSDSEMELDRYSIMKFKKAKCNVNAFSGQDIIGFHNAASRGKEDALMAYIDRGINLDVLDSNSNDTALIKAAKFCQVSVAKILLDKGANKALKNDRDENALVYANKSSFHEGCPELIKMLN